MRTLEGKRPYLKAWRWTAFPAARHHSGSSSLRGVGPYGPDSAP